MTTKDVSALSEALRDAADEGGVDDARRCLEDGADVDGTAGRGKNAALHLACYRKNVAMAELLLEAGADPNKRGGGNKTPLTMACDSWGTADIADLVRILLAHGADPKNIKRGGDGPLHYACMYNKARAITLLIEGGAGVNKKGAYGRTPLHYSATKSLAAVDALLNAGARTTIKNDSGETALHEMASADDADPAVAARLIHGGASLDARDTYGSTVLQSAASYGTADMVTVLIEAGALRGETPEVAEDPVSGRLNAAVRAAINASKLETVKVLFEHIPDENYALLDAVLASAVEKGDDAFVAAIIARIPREKGLGGEALENAARAGDLKRVTQLLDAGVAPEPTDGYQTPLMVASRYGQLEVVRALLEAGANHQTRDGRGNTALHFAAWEDHPPVLETLLEAGAGLDAVNGQNWTPLMQACLQGHEASALFLLDEGARHDLIGSEEGATALSLALHRRRTSLIELLQSRGAVERPIQWREASAPYGSFFQCAICEKIPQRKRLGNSERVREFRGLDLIATDFSQPDRHMSIENRLGKCQICGTLYRHRHSVDTEDAFVGGPNIDQTIQRMALAQLKITLPALELHGELRELEERLPQLVEECTERLRAGDLDERGLDYAIDTLLDHHVEQRDWPMLEALLRHGDHRVGLAIAERLLTMVGEGSHGGHWAGWFKTYKTIHRDSRAAFLAFFESHREDFAGVLETCLDRADNPEPWAELLESARKYEL